MISHQVLGMAGMKWQISFSNRLNIPFLFIPQLGDYYYITIYDVIVISKSIFNPWGKWLSDALESDYSLCCESIFFNIYQVCSLLSSSVYVLHSGFSHLDPHHYLLLIPVTTHLSRKLCSTHLCFVFCLGAQTGPFMWPQTQNCQWSLTESPEGTLL